MTSDCVAFKLRFDSMDLIREPRKVSLDALLEDLTPWLVQLPLPEDGPELGDHSNAFACCICHRNLAEENHQSFRVTPSWISFLELNGEKTLAGELAGRGDDQTSARACCRCAVLLEIGDRLSFRLSEVNRHFRERLQCRPLSPRCQNDASEFALSDENYEFPLEVAVDEAQENYNGVSDVQISEQSNVLPVKRRRGRPRQVKDPLESDEPKRCKKRGRPRKVAAPSSPRAKSPKAENRTETQSFELTVNGSSDLKCDLCSKAFGTVSALQEHRSLHCPSCKYWTDKRRNFERHVKRHSVAEDDYVHECSHCDQKFRVK